MFGRLQKGLVLKSKTYEEGETFYTIILKERWLFWGLYKTARLYKNWKDDFGRLEVSINKNDFRNYLKDIKEGNLEFPDKEEMEELRENIENLPEEIKKVIYRGGKIKEFHNNLYGAEIQKISELEFLSKT